MLGLIIWLSVVSVICIVEAVTIVILLCKQKNQNNNRFIDLKFSELEDSIKKSNEEIEDLKCSMFSAREK